MRIVLHFLIVTNFLFSQISTQNLPCDQYWKYIVGNDGSKQGLITIFPKSSLSHEMKIKLTVAAQLPSNNYGTLQLVKDPQSTVNDIKNGLPILYTVRFPIQNPLPKLKEILYNNEVLCSEPSDNQNDGFTMTTIKLRHNLYLPGQSPPIFSQTRRPQEAIFNRQSFTSAKPLYAPQPLKNPNIIPYQAKMNPTTTFRPITFPPTTKNIPQTTSKIPFRIESSSINSGLVDELNSQCGVPDYRSPSAIGLIVRGNTVIRGQFPWLAALFSDGFKCGGSLISAKLVLTAAHCIQDKNKEVPRKPEDCFFVFGKYFITPKQNTRKDEKWSGTSEIIVHPIWDPKADSYDGDLAIAVLEKSIPFTKFIQPICLWTKTPNYHDLIDKKGVVAGWGKTESSITESDEPHWLELPVVDDATCLRSNAALLKITSPRNFCVGTRDGRGPCQGDSGGGFIVKNEGKWYLRGLVSSALFDAVLQMCDTKNYAVFTDVAQFKDWIVDKMKKYA